MPDSEALLRSGARGLGLSAGTLGSPTPQVTRTKQLPAALLLPVDQGDVHCCGFTFEKCFEISL